MTAKEKLLKIMEKRAWYKDLIDPTTARQYKFNLTRDKNISDAKVKEILLLLGHKPKQKEVW